MRGLIEDLEGLLERVSPSVIGKDHFLVERGWGSGGNLRWFFVLELGEVRGGNKKVMIAGRVMVEYVKLCDAFSVRMSAAAKGYGPLIYDAAMQILYPKWVTPDTGRPSTAATGIWKKYMGRGDVEREECDRGFDIEALNQRFRQQGSLRGKLMTEKEFIKHPKVVAWVGKLRSDWSVSSDAWDKTPKIPGAHESLDQLGQQISELLGGETEARDVGEKRNAERDGKALRAAEKRGRKAGGKPKPKKASGTERGIEGPLATRSRTWILP